MATIFTFGKISAQANAAPLSAPPPFDPRRDWNNQELSDLYRAIASLSQAGILVEMERGLTDEGDPWLVLCRLDGEVFIHFCRLEGRYLLDSPALPAPLRGYNFADLIDLFIAQAAMAAAPNVVAFRASKVFLHPAALITILVWSLYVWSSDTTQAGEANEADLHLGLPNDSLLASQPEGDTAPAAAPAKGIAIVDGLPADRLLTRLQQAIDHTASLPAASNAAAMQMLAVVGTLVLSAIAPTVLHEDGDAPSALLADAAAPAFEPNGPPDFIDFSDTLAQSAWANSDSAAPLLAAAMPETELELAEPHGTPAAHPVILQTAQTSGHAAPIIHSDAAAFSAEPHHTIAMTPATAGADEAHKPVAQSHASPVIDFTAFFNTGVTLARYDVDGISLLASFNPASLDALQITSDTSSAGVVDLQFDAAQFATPPELVRDGTYNDAARAFIDAFLEQSNDIQIIASANQLVLIDLTAFDEVGDRAYACSWTMQDGGVISTLGHIDIFANYHLA